jgi:hypothetical protein
MSGTVQCQEARGVRCRMPMTHRVNRQQDRTNWSRIGYFRWPSIRAKALSRTKVMNLVTNLLRHPRRTYFSAVRDTRAKYDAEPFLLRRTTWTRGNSDLPRRSVCRAATTLLSIVRSSAILGKSKSGYCRANLPGKYSQTENSVSGPR